MPDPVLCTETLDVNLMDGDTPRREEIYSDPQTGTLMVGLAGDWITFPFALLRQNVQMNGACPACGLLSPPEIVVERNGEDGSRPAGTMARVTVTCRGCDSSYWTMWYEITGAPFGQTFRISDEWWRSEVRDDPTAKPPSKPKPTIETRIPRTLSRGERP